MTSYEEFFKGKKITQVGLGLLGRGVGDARFLARMGAELTVTDLKTPKELEASLDALKEFKNIHYTLGRHDMADFRDRDLVINGAAVPLDSPYIAEARANGIPVTMSTALFARFARGMGTTLLGITGTRGKSTTTEMIVAIAKAAGANVLLGGNIRGVSTLAQLLEVAPGTLSILELDSWQLQGFRDEHTSPTIAVFTNLYPDHLNYYKGDMDAYLFDKAQIFLNQHQEDTLVLGSQVAPIVEHAYASRMMSRVVVASAEDLPSDWKLTILGVHNRANAACALAAARALKIDDSVSRTALERFMGVEGRLQFVREIHGVNIYNDNSATTPEATIAGLRAVGSQSKRNVVLIMGGDDKSLDMSELIAEIPKWCSKVVLFKERGTDRIRDQVLALVSDGLVVYETQGLPATVGRAVSIAEPGEVILFSPAFSSFGKWFTNEHDRGDQFLALIKQLT